ncbi:MAG: RlmE family RNA methyltransferase [Candidatus Nezhaarchaeota archaeon]|nr:RlmE family RNA methyltransferase [Candidatus Nezhaarchaeota archaeon]MCX8141974.1 RlmE family RNA methyltransferase [Candidatus Nezhaarchaeota archaeon]MDW8050245.1 RlmE family RNA methyltransferase [Nitrososphaerota archaeon]
MSKRWHKERARDFYYKHAKQLGLRSRAAFKLIEIAKKFNIFKRGYIVLDLGAYPGGWLQVASRAVGKSGLVIGVDLKPVKDLGFSNVILIVGDVCDESTHEKIVKVLPRKADVILSDISPKLTGVWPTDMAKHYYLIDCVLMLVLKVLKQGGTAVIKAFQGGEERELIARLCAMFNEVHKLKPKASKPKSRELYLVCLGFRGSN